MLLLNLAIFNIATYGRSIWSLYGCYTHKKEAVGQPDGLTVWLASTPSTPPQNVSDLQATGWLICSTTAKSLETEIVKTST